MNKKIIKINESQFLRNFANGHLITENRASKNQSLARKMGSTSKRSSKRM